MTTRKTWAVRVYFGSKDDDGEWINDDHIDYADDIDRVTAMELADKAMDEYAHKVEDAWLVAVYSYPGWTEEFAWIRDGEDWRRA